MTNCSNKMSREEYFELTGQSSRMSTTSKLSQIAVKQNKYHVANKEDRTWIGNWRGREIKIIFASAKEMNRWNELRIDQLGGHISNLQYQERFILKEKTDNSGAITYISDFSYYDLKNRKWICEDVKSPMTRKLSTYRMKKKMFLDLFPNIEFKES